MNPFYDVKCEKPTYISFNIAEIVKFLILILIKYCYPHKLTKHGHNVGFDN